MIRNMRWLVATAATIILAACSPAPGGNTTANASAGAPPAPGAVTNAVVQPLPSATPTAYPPCSATVKDHCVEP